MVIQRTQSIVLWNVPSKRVDICLMKTNLSWNFCFEEIFRLDGFPFDLMRDTKMKMNLIGEKSLRHARNIIQGWKNATNVIFL